MNPFTWKGRLAWGLGVIWTVLVAASLLWNFHQARQTALELASTEAQLSYNKDLAYRLWAASHGGVYVPVTSQTPPNPYLSHIPERDIQTPSGRALTLMNPAYMTRQVYELAARVYGIKGHLTSLKPIRPENAPDPWETRALSKPLKPAPLRFWKWWNWQGALTYALCVPGVQRGHVSSVTPPRVTKKAISEAALA